MVLCLLTAKTDHVPACIVLVLQQNNEGQPQQQVLLMLHDDKVGYCNLDGTLKLKKRKRVPTDEPRPAKVGTNACGSTGYRSITPQGQQG